MSIDLQPYGTFRPTGFDNLGAFLPERANWLVFPIPHNRDSSILEQSNFATALDMIGGESVTVEVHRFGHWACGWFELILIHPEYNVTIAAAKSVVELLSVYPVLDDDDFSNREFEAAASYWASMSVRDRADTLKRYGRGVSIFAARRADLPSDDNGGLISLLAS